jgi:hypothetical protein
MIWFVMQETAEALATEALDACVLRINSAYVRLREAFFATTQTAFFDALRDLGWILDADPDEPGALDDARRRFFETALRPAAFDAFALHATPRLGRAGGGAGRQGPRPSRRGPPRAWQGGQALFVTLGLALPEPKAARTAR